MKTTLKILLIVLIGVLVAGAFYLTVENTTLFSNITDAPESRGEHGERPRPEGKKGHDEGPKDDHHNEGPSLSKGLAEVGSSLAKISIITMIVLAIQFIFRRFQKGKTAKKLAV